MHQLFLCGIENGGCDALCLGFLCVAMGGNICVHWLSSIVVCHHWNPAGDMGFGVGNGGEWGGGTGSICGAVEHLGRGGVGT